MAVTRQRDETRSAAPIGKLRKKPETISILFVSRVFAHAFTTFLRLLKCPLALKSVLGIACGHCSLWLCFISGEVITTDAT